MQYDFLAQFARRIKNIAKYAVLLKNSGQKAIWKNYGFVDESQQITVLLAVMLFIMEKSLRYENCTIDDIGSFLDDLNNQYFQQDMSLEDCQILGDFVINTVLSNDGIPMYYQSYDFVTRASEKFNVNYVSNKIIYDEHEMRRTSYELTDMGYDFILGTLEIEENMKFTVQDMLYRMHMEKQSYDKALDDIRQMFARIRGQAQRVQDAMQRIRRNPHNYNIEDYGTIQQVDLETIGEIRKKLQLYSGKIKVDIVGIENSDSNDKVVNKHTLETLQKIDSYLNLALDEYQKLTNSHYDLNFLYAEALENMASLDTVQRFSLRTEVFDPIMRDIRVLDKIDYFLRPLFNKKIDKDLNMHKMLVPQRGRGRWEDEPDTEIMDFDQEAWEQEQERKRQARNRLYQDSIACIIKAAYPNGHITLSELSQLLEERIIVKEAMIPTLGIFKEIMIELIRREQIDIALLRQERQSFIQEEGDNFSLSRCILKVLDENPQWQHIDKIYIVKLPIKEPVVFEDILTEQGRRCKILCSEVNIILEGEE